MKKAKFIFRLNSQMRGKVYINGKWLKDVCMVNVHGEPFSYDLEIEQYERDKNNRLVVEDYKIKRKITKYHYGKLQDM